MMAEVDLAGKSFEELLEMLEHAVQELDGDTLTLEQAVAAYERSVAISQACQDILDQAELRIEQIDAKSTLTPDLDDGEIPFD